MSNRFFGSTIFESLKSTYNTKIPGIEIIGQEAIVSGGENAPINGDGEFFGEVSLSSSPFCVEGAVVLVAVKDASRRCAVAFGHP